MKKLSVIALILVLAMAFTGCSTSELSLYNAFKKTQNVTSMESDTAISFTLEGEGFSEEEQANLQEITSMLNSMKMDLHQKMVQNKEKTASRALVDAKVNLGGIGMDMTVWVDADMSGDKAKLVEIIKMPPILMNSLSTKDGPKEYIVYDFQEIMGENQEQINIDEFMKFSKEVQPKITKLIKDSEEKFNPGFEIAKYKDKKIIDEKELTIYEVKLDDAAFKNLIRYTVNYYIDNKDIVEFVKEYMNLVMGMTKPKTEEEKLAQDKVKDELETLEKDLPNIKEKFNSFMDTYKDVKIIGDKGIVLEYGVNSDGYIVHEAGNIDLRIDLESIGKIAQGKESAQKGILKFGISYNSKVYNINSEMKIDLPVVNESNSLNFTDMINSTTVDKTLEPTQP